MAFLAGMLLTFHLQAYAYGTAAGTPALNGGYVAQGTYWCLGYETQGTPGWFGGVSLVAEGEC